MKYKQVDHYHYKKYNSVHVQDIYLSLMTACDVIQEAPGRILLQKGDSNADQDIVQLRINYDAEKLTTNVEKIIIVQQDQKPILDSEHNDGKPKNRFTTTKEGRISSSGMEPTEQVNRKSTRNYDVEIKQNSSTVNADDMGITKEHNGPDEMFKTDNESVEDMTPTKTGIQPEGMSPNKNSDSDSDMSPTKISK